MLVSFNWLARHVDLDGIDTAALIDRFILSVAEIEEVHHVGGGLDGVVLGRVLTVAPIEGARVQATTVDLGPLGTKSIVCGAPNVAPGQLVPVATVGTTLGDLTIAAREVRGVMSEGMICAEDELGLGEDHDGILVFDDDEPSVGGLALGTPIAEAFAIRDTLVEIDNKSLTHRPDLWGHRGLAREVAALLDRELKPMALDVAFTDATPLDLVNEVPERCLRYTACTMDGVTVRRSPFWLRLLLQRVGTRAISNVVDATNFVMLDLGQPLHAFDARQIAGGRIGVRAASQGEVFTTLDGQQRRLDARDTLIADGERGVALAGVMGGENSEIKDDTAAVVLESATFDASTVRMTATRLGLRTDSSARFEKSLDPELPPVAARAFIALLQELDPAVTVTSALMDSDTERAAPPTIDLRVSLVEARLGCPMGRDKVVGILESLAFGVTSDADDADLLHVDVPTWRATKDVGIAADLVEEVGRMHGYDNIPPRGAVVEVRRPDPNALKRFEASVRAHMSDASGFDELMTYSFDFDPLLAKLGVEPGPRVTLRNPISQEMPALRTQLGPNLLGVLERNSRRDKHVRVYELGRVFTPHPEPGPGNLPAQPTTLGALVASAEAAADDAPAMFFALKGVLQGLARAVERPVPTMAEGGVAHVWAHPVRQVRLVVDGQDVGYLADVHPRALHQLDVAHRAAVLELDLEAWRAATPEPRTYTPLPRFPSVFRDFAVVVPTAVRAGDVAEAIRASSPDGLVAEVAFQSVYTGEGVAAGQKSLAWSVTFRRPDGTLDQDAVQALEQAVWASLAERVSGAPRA